MASKQEITRRKQLHREIAKKEHEEFMGKLPLEESIILELFDFLDIELGERGCQHNYQITEDFLQSKGIYIEKLYNWFLEHGGGCDCEILYNIEDLFPRDEEPINPIAQPKREKLYQLRLPNLEIEKIPPPWKLYKTGNSYQFQFGKRYDIKVAFIEHLNSSDWDNTEYWKQLWEKETGLEIGKFNEVIYDNYGEFALVTCKTKGWIPVLTWIKPTDKSWGFMFRTELSRLRGDMNELRNLLRQIK